jgi:SPP1 gp7 family putative phage head morphogenesis protein
VKQLKPIVLKESYYDNIEKEINAFFYTLIYEPIIKMMNETLGDFYNTISDLVNAILKNQVQYYDGQFHGKFNSKISKEIKKLGGKFNKKTGTWGLGQRSLPFEVQSAIAVADRRFLRLHDDIIEQLNKIDIDDAIRNVSFDNTYIHTLDKLEKDFRATAKAIEIIPEYNPVRIAENYSNNMKLYIKKWTEDNIVKLRGEVQKNANAGYRAENLVKKIQTNYGVSKSKAKFLAKTETSLLMTEYKTDRYKSVGVTRFRWSSSKDSRVRSWHKQLDGKVFSIDAPPVIDQNTGQTGLPGQAWGPCRCKMIPLLD